MNITNLVATLEDGSQVTLFPQSTPTTSPTMELTVDVDPNTTSATVVSVTNK